MKKVVLFIGAFLVIGLVGVYLSLGSLVRTAVQKGGTYALGVETTLGSADVNPFGGRLGLNELTVRNPPGFEGESFLRMQAARVVVPPTSLTSERVGVTRLILEGFTVDLESKGPGNSNYGVLLENLEKLGAERGGAPDAKPSAPGEGGGKVYLIEKILITDVTASVRVAAGGTTVADASVHIPLIEIETCHRVEFVQTHPSVAQNGVVIHHGNQFFFCIELVLDVADEFLEDIFESDQTRRPSVFINGDGDVNPPFLELGKQVVDHFRFGNMHV